LGVNSPLAVTRLSAGCLGTLHHADSASEGAETFE